MLSFWCLLQMWCINYCAAVVKIMWVIFKTFLKNEANIAFVFLIILQHNRKASSWIFLTNFWLSWWLKELLFFRGRLQIEGEVKHRCHKLQLGHLYIFISSFNLFRTFLSPFEPEPFRFRGCRWKRGWRQAAASSRRCLGSWTKPALCGRLLQPQGNCWMSQGCSSKPQGALILCFSSS